MLSVDKTTLTLDVEVRVEPDFDFRGAEYRAFYGPQRATAFQAPIWLDHLHRRLAPLRNARQHTVTIRSRADDSLVALLPLVVQQANGLKILQPADFGLSDYNAIVAEPATLEMVARDPAVLDKLNAAMRGCDALFFRKVRDDGFDIGRLLVGARSTPNENAAYSCDVGDDFEEWSRRTLRKKFSKELSRLQRVIEREEGSYEHRPAEGEAEIRAAFDALLSWRGKFADDLVADPAIFAFYRDYALEAVPAGEAVTYVSYAGAVPVAMLFGLTGDGAFHAVLIGSDTEKFGKSSPGTQILYQIIKRRFGEGFRSFDMGLGNTGYKTHFRVDEVPLKNWTMARSVPGAAVALIYHHAKPLKNWLRRYARHVR